MEKIVDKIQVNVFYDEKNKLYIKKFNPKFSKKVSYILKLRKYPGENFKYMSDYLESELEIKTPRVIYSDKYEVITQEIEGKLLINELMTEDIKKINFLIDEYIKLVAKVIKKGIFYKDFNFKNFIVKNNELYALDLEGYKKGIFMHFRKNKLINLMKDEQIDKYIRTLLKEGEKILENKTLEIMNKEITYEKLWGKLKKEIY